MSVITPHQLPPSTLCQPASTVHIHSNSLFRKYCICNQYITLHIVNQFAQYHANQGLVLFIASFAIGFATKILAFVAPLLSMAISGVSGIVILVFAILGIINVCQLEAKPLPIIGGITLIKSY